MQASPQRIKILKCWDGLAFKSLDEFGNTKDLKDKFRPHFRDNKRAGLRRFVCRYPEKFIFYHQYEEIPYTAFRSSKSTPAQLGIRR